MTVPLSSPPGTPSRQHGNMRRLPQASPTDAAKLQEEENAWQAQTLQDIKAECEANLEESRSMVEPNSSLLSPVLQESLGMSPNGSPDRSYYDSIENYVGSKSTAGSKDRVIGSKDLTGSKERTASKERSGSKQRASLNTKPEAIPRTEDSPVSPLPQNAGEQKIVRRSQLNGSNWRRTVTRTISIQSTDMVDTPEFMWQKYLKHFTSPQLDWLSDQFETYDTDGTGLLPTQRAVWVAQNWMKSQYSCENPNPSDDVVEASLPNKDLDHFTFEHVVSFVKKCEFKVLEADQWAGFPEQDVLEFKSVFKDFCKSKAIGAQSGEEALSTQQTFEILEELGRDTTSKESQERVVQIIKEVDVNKSGDLDFLEFLHLLRRVQAIDAATARKRERELIQQSGFSDDEVEKFHQLFDKYQSKEGTFSLENMRELMQQMDIDLTPERRRYIAAMVHKVSDQNIMTFGEFLVLFHELLAEDFAQMRSSVNAAPDRAAYNPMSSNNEPVEEISLKQLSAGEWLERRRSKFGLCEGSSWVTRMINKKQDIKKAIF